MPLRFSADLKVGEIEIAFETLRHLFPWSISVAQMRLLSGRCLQWCRYIQDSCGQGAFEIRFDELNPNLFSVMVLCKDSPLLFRKNQVAALRVQDGKVFDIEHIGPKLSGVGA